MEETISFEAESYSSFAREQYDSFRLSNYLCDVLIVGKEGKRHPAHRIMLASASPYFRAMFEGKFLKARNHHQQHRRRRSEGSNRVRLQGKNRMSCVSPRRPMPLRRGSLSTVRSSSADVQRLDQTSRQFVELSKLRHICSSIRRLDIASTLRSNFRCEHNEISRHRRLPSSLRRPRDPAFESRRTRRASRKRRPWHSSPVDQTRRNVTSTSRRKSRNKSHSSTANRLFKRDVVPRHSFESRLQRLVVVMPTSSGMRRRSSRRRRKPEI